MPVRAEIRVNDGRIRELFRRVLNKTGIFRTQTVQEIAELVRTEAVKRAPILTGELRSSAEVTRLGVGQYNVTFTKVREPSKMYPAGFDVALWLHEYWDPKTPKPPPIGPKYLTRAVEENRDKIRRIVEIRVQAWLSPEISRVSG